MAIREIIVLPDARLRQVCDPVKAVDEGVRALIDDMFETMYDAPGVGLAAIQIAVPQRVIVVDVAKDEAPPAPMAFINPEIVWTSEETRVHQEGCLSIPDYFEEVERPSKVRVRFVDREGMEGELEADGLLATCLQHEVDHLNGVLFIDHLSRLKRDLVVKRFRKQARLAEKPERPRRGAAEARAPLSRAD
jgi:peptide deformylase